MNTDNFHEDEINLLDYLRVIWKRKILIVLLTMVIVIATGVVSFRMPKTYRAEAIISIGKVLALTTQTAIPTQIALYDPASLAQSIPLEYSLNEEAESKGYTLKAEVLKVVSTLKVIGDGPDRIKVAEFLEKRLDKIVEDHFKKTESSIRPYHALIKKLEMDIENIKLEVIPVEKRLKNAKTGKDDLILTITAQNYFFQKKKEMRSIQKDILLYQSLVDNLEEYKTKVIGGVRSAKAPVKPKLKRNILLSGIVGLFFSVFIAFFWEYIEKARIQENKKE